MENNTEKFLKTLENEIMALKASQEISALNIPVVTKTTSFQSVQNHLSVNYTDSGTEYSYTINAAERIEVTFTTSRGSNTIAVLEVSVNHPEASPQIQRVGYDGGARWIVVGQPHIDTSTGQIVWKPTTYDFVVHSMLDGTLSARSMTS